MQEDLINQVIYLGDILERCDFQHFWERMAQIPMTELCDRIIGFKDSVRKFVCHVVGITFQTIDKSLLAQLLGNIDGKYQSSLMIIKLTDSLPFSEFFF